MLGQRLLHKFLWLSVLKSRTARFRNQISHQNSFVSILNGSSSNLLSVLNNIKNEIFLSSTVLICQYMVSQFLTGFSATVEYEKILKNFIIFKEIVPHSKLFLIRNRGKTIACPTPRQNWNIVRNFSIFSSAKGNCVTWFDTTNCITQSQRKFRRTHARSPHFRNSIPRWGKLSRIWSCGNLTSSWETLKDR